MSYQKEQQSKNDEYISVEMQGCTSEDVLEVRNQCHAIWATNTETIEIVKAKKDEIATRATPEELDEAFKHFRL